ETQVLKPNKAAFLLASKIILENDLAAFPTETVYGLGANAFSDIAVRKIFEVKGRPCDNPLIVHVHCIEKIFDITVNVNDMAQNLMRAFMPGPLTLVLKKSPRISNLVTCNLDTVAVRIPDNKVAVKFLKACGIPVAAPSANLSTRPSPTSARHVFDDLQGKIPLILDGGSCKIGIESTVVDATGNFPVILRPGIICKNDIEKVCGHVENLKISGKIISPGTKYKHYAPDCKIIIFSKQNEVLKKFVEQKKAEGLKVLTVTKNQNFLNLENAETYNIETDFAKNLYSNFRKWEKTYDVVLIERPNEFGVGASIFNRLIKAAENNILN
ncbi:MAG: L-threonylcarbamoyladenylate synthase, partial [Firmicutes bacterium]|nr:L-threonylcarbamoyladenylate synthase [Bacillota bacterium]